MCNALCSLDQNVIYQEDAHVDNSPVYPLVALDPNSGVQLPEPWNIYRVRQASQPLTIVNDEQSECALLAVKT